MLGMYLEVTLSCIMMSGGIEYHPSGTNGSKPFLLANFDKNLYLF